MTDESFFLLLEQYLVGTASPEEKALVDEWYNSFGREPGLSGAADGDAAAAFLELKKHLGLHKNNLVKHE